MAQSVKERENKFKEAQKIEKAKIKAESNKFKRFWKWVWFWFLFPWKWCFVELRDWQTILIFFIVITLVGSEVWVPGLLGTIFWGTEFGNTMLGVMGTCLFFWNCVPCTPFLMICITITIGAKTLFNKFKK